LEIIVRDQFVDMYRLEGTNAVISPLCSVVILPRILAGEKFCTDYKRGTRNFDEHSGKVKLLRGASPDKNPKQQVRAWLESDAH
jgi:hypothetical protein